MNRFQVSGRRTAAGQAGRFAGLAGLGSGPRVRGRRRGVRWAAVMAGSLAALAVPAAVPSGALASSPTGLTWTQQHPAVSPHPRANAAMTYDAATGTVVLFGGISNQTAFTGTWTWDGSAWTKRAPATSPPGTVGGSMAYDAATGTAVLFGGQTIHGQLLSDTWTWGSD